MQLKYYFLFLAALLFNCRHSLNTNTANNEYLEQQITERLHVIAQSTLQTSSSLPDIKKIAGEIDKLILLSKDVENLKASLNQSNSFFENTAKNYNIESSDFEKLYEGMPLEDITTVIKKNELNLLNKIIFKYYNTSGGMFTAQ